jgi:hypothetical protein
VLEGMVSFQLPEVEGLGKAGQGASIWAYPTLPRIEGAEKLRFKLTHYREAVDLTRGRDYDQQ